ncbi:hypothetical protein H9P43_005385 [Blastocladiella emersonii ATCC 22665]|nr:hypothetical protein H9P43_005385 [Blastocladiella emersonii ATCC 22665]
MPSTHSTPATSCNRLHYHPSTPILRKAPQAVAALVGVSGNVFASTLTKFTTCRAPSTPSSGKWADPHLRHQLAHDAPKPASLGQRQQTSAMIKNMLRGLAARVVAGLKHALGCACESQFEVIKSRGSIYHDKLLRGSPTDWSALPSSRHSAAHTFMAKLNNPGSCCTRYQLGPRASPPPAARVPPQVNQLHRAPLPSPTAFKVHLLESAVEQLSSPSTTRAVKKQD